MMTGAFTFDAQIQKCIEMYFSTPCRKTLFLLKNTLYSEVDLCILSFVSLIIKFKFPDQNFCVEDSYYCI